MKCLRKDIRCLSGAQDRAAENGLERNVLQPVGQRPGLILAAFGQVSLGKFKLILSGPGASGSRPMPDGHKQEPGGWNRVILEVRDLPARIEALKKAGLRFRNEMEVGPGGKQIQLEDPDGNPIELFEPAH